MSRTPFPNLDTLNCPFRGNRDFFLTPKPPCSRTVSILGCRGMGQSAENRGIIAFWPLNMGIEFIGKDIASCWPQCLSRIQAEGI